MSDNWNEPTAVPAEHQATDRNQRIKICQACDRLNELKFCTECNCFMPVKTWFKTKHCPLGKW